VGRQPQLGEAFLREHGKHTTTSPIRTAASMVAYALRASADELIEFELAQESGGCERRKLSQGMSTEDLRAEPGFLKDSEETEAD